MTAIDFTPLYILLALLVLAVVFLLGWAIGAQETERYYRARYQSVIDDLRDVPEAMKNASVKAYVESRVASHNYGKDSDK